MKLCLACGHQRDINDGNPAESCPGCGRVYAKVEANAKAQTSPPMQGIASVDTSFWGGLGEGKRTMICVLVALVVGYFAGREHIKYQFLQAFAGVAESINESLSTTFAQPPSPSQADRPTPAKKKVQPPPPPREQPLTATLTDKSFSPGEYGQDKLLIQIEFESKVPRGIRGFNGELDITDILGNSIFPVKVEITTPIDAHDTITWHGSIKYNQFLTRHNELKDKKLEDLASTFRVTKVLFQDGELVDYE